MLNCNFHHKRTQKHTRAFTLLQKRTKNDMITLEVWTMRMIPNKETLTIEFKSVL